MPFLSRKAPKGGFNAFSSNPGRLSQQSHVGQRKYLRIMNGLLLGEKIRKNMG